MLYVDRTRPAGGRTDALEVLCVPAGAVVYHQGSPALYSYEVRRGVTRTCRFYPDGVRHVTGFHFNGDAFGLDVGLYSETAEALTESEFVRYRTPKLLGEPSVSPQIVQRALKSARRCIFLLGRRSAIERMCVFLLMIARDAETGRSVTLPMCRMDIADHLGLTVSTVSRTISALVRMQLIALQGPNTFCLLDPEGVRLLGGITEAEAFLIESRVQADGG